MQTNKHSRLPFFLSSWQLSLFDPKKKNIPHFDYIASAAVYFLNVFVVMGFV